MRGIAILALIGAVGCGGKGSDGRSRSTGGSGGDGPVGGATTGGATSGGAGHAGSGDTTGGSDPGAGGQAGGTVGGEAGTAQGGHAENVAGRTAGGAAGAAEASVAGESAGGAAGMPGGPPPAGAGAGGAAGGVPETAGEGGQWAGAGTSAAGRTSAGGAGGAGGGGGAATCDDGDVETRDFVSPQYGCGHVFDQVPSDDEFWIEYDAGFGVDGQTSLGWTIIPSGSRNQADSATACAALELGGLTGWRLPTIDEARTLAAGCEPNEPGGSCEVADPGCLGSSCLTNCASCVGGAGPHEFGYCKVDSGICTHFHTSSTCTDCTPAKDFIYVATNGYVATLEITTLVGTICTRDGIPNGLP